MWRTVKLGEVIEKTRSVNPSTEFPNNHFDYVDVSSVNNATLRIEETQKLLGEDAPSRARREILEDDVIFATIRPTLRRVALVPSSLGGQICSTGYIVLRANRKQVLPSYLFYVMISSKAMSYMKNSQTGASYPAVTDEQVKGFEFELPPLAEQQRIVEKLDAAFAEIDRAIEVAEAKEAEVGKLKASLLSSMIVTDSGSSVNLKEVCTIDWGNTSLTKKSYEENGEFLAVSATGADGKISFYEHEADVCVLSAIGAQCGKMFFPQERFTAIKNTITLTPKHDVVDGKYLYYLFTHIELPRRGAAQPFIAKGDIEKFQVPFLPSLEEQRRIVNKLDAGFEAAADTLALVSQSIHNFVSLKSAILAQELQPSEAA